jgi:hypothetical protein
MKTKSKIYINISLFVAIAIVIIMFFVWPLFGDIKKDSVDLINQKNEVFSFEEQMIELKEFSQNKKYYQDNFLTAESMFIDYKNPIVLIKFLEDIAKDSNVDLNISLSSSSIQKVEKDVWSSIFFQVNFSGSLASCGPVSIFRLAKCW